MCEWLIEQGIEFEMHKVLGNGRICDFYFNGTYWEMDGMDRQEAYFAEKYGDLPYVVVTPEDFKPIVLQHLGVSHAMNGDAIVSIEPCGEAMTYDVEMAADGPLNYIANRIVSHNSHACAYAWVAYQTAYLKANYTAEFMAATLTTEASDAKKVIAAVEECRRMGVPVLPPDINRSDSSFTVEQVEQSDEEGGQPRWGVRFGLVAIKNVGTRPIDEILESRRQHGPFVSLVDLFARTDSRNLTRGAAECLIKAGALDSLGKRSQLLQNLDRALTLGQQQRKMREIGQDTLFGMGGETAYEELTLADVPEYPQQQLLSWEKEMLNLYLSAHPLAPVASILQRRVNVYTTDLSEEWAGQKVVVGGRVTDVRRITTKKGDTMAAIQLEDLRGSIEVIVFPKVYQLHSSHWREDAILLVTGSVKMREEEPQVVCESAEEFVPTDDELHHQEYLLRIRIPRAESAPLDIAHVDQLLTALMKYPGDDRFELIVQSSEWEAKLAPGKALPGVKFCPELMLKLEEILGPNTVDPIAVLPPL
jgi:DNA polymerase-3 subunit alpha